MLTESRLFEEQKEEEEEEEKAERLGDPKKVTQEEIEREREKKDEGSRDSARKNPFIKGCASSETERRSAGDAENARRNLEMKRNAKETAALDLPNGGGPAAGIT